jgi:hypothetical protein
VTGTARLIEDARQLSGRMQLRCGGSEECRDHDLLLDLAAALEAAEDELNALRPMKINWTAITKELEELRVEKEKTKDVVAYWAQRLLAAESEIQSLRRQLRKK